jgi:hypothetical protein
MPIYIPRNLFSLKYNTAQKELQAKFNYICECSFALQHALTLKLSALAFVGFSKRYMTKKYAEKAAEWGWQTRLLNGGDCCG